jgi:hypothetical protein
MTYSLGSATPRIAMAWRRVPARTTMRGDSLGVTERRATV